MKDYLAIVRWDGGDHDKYAWFDEAEANAHVLEYGGFVVPDPGGNILFWTVDTTAKTVVYDSAADLIAEEMSSWRYDIEQTDKSMTRQMEDYIDEQEVVLKPGRIKDAYADKKEVRARQP